MAGEKTGDEKWAALQMLDGNVVEHVGNGTRVRALSNGKYFDFQYKFRADKEWAATNCLRAGQYRLVEAPSTCSGQAPAEAQEVPSASSGQAPGYERWEIVGPEQSCKAFLCAAEPHRPGISGRYWPLYTAQFLPRFRYFVFEKEDDKGVLHRWYHRDLHVVWDEEHQHFSLGSVGPDDGVAYHCLADVEVVDPVAVLMRP